MNARVPRRVDTADHFRLMADFAPVMIWLASPDLKHVYFNHLWLEFTGRSLQDELDQGWMEGIHPADRERCAASLASAFEARSPFEIEFRLRRADGQYRWIIDKGVPIVNDGKLAGFVGSCHDFTERKRTEDEARDQFLAVVSHELRSPLNGIKSWTHVLENQLRDTDPPVRRALEGIMIGVEHQVHLIDDLLDLTRAMSGNLALAKLPMPLLPVLADAVESLRAAASEKSLRIVTDYAIDRCEIDADPDRVRQVFSNLIMNAVKFTAAGGTIWVNARCEDAFAVIEVRDDGAGIPPDFVPHLFDPFRQAEQPSSSRRRDGLGLGLALVQRLVELHGGKVTCDSAGRDRGATFRVFLPARMDASAPRVTRDARDEDSRLPSLDGIRVLLIDDQREARESVAALLGQAGARVFTASSGREALAYLSLAGDSEPDVILCDIAMPDEDGYATLKRIRAWEQSRSRERRPVVALSAYTQREDRIRALSEGFQMHLTKPVAPAELAAVIACVARDMRV